MKNKLFLLILFISIIHNGQDFSSKKNRMEEDIEYEIRGCLKSETVFFYAQKRKAQSFPSFCKLINLLCVK